MDFVENVLAGPVAEILGTVLMLLLNAGIVAVLGKKWKEGKYAAVAESARAAVNDVYESYVRELKASNEDGKLTAEERKSARARAIALAVNGLKGSANKLAQNLAENGQLAALIESIIRKAKSGTE